MSYIYPDRDALTQAIGEAAQQFEQLVRAIEPEASTTPVPNSSWTVGDTAAHVLTVIRRALYDPRRSDTPEDTARLNDLCLQELEERGPGALADMLATDTNKMLNKSLPRLPDDLLFRFHAGAMTTVRPTMGVILGEFLWHGYDMANALGQPWPINPHHAALNWQGIASLIPAWLKPGVADNLDERWAIVFPDQPLVIGMHFADGTLTLDTDPDGPANYTLTYAPVEFLAVFPYKRRASDDANLNRLADRFELV